MTADLASITLTGETEGFAPVADLSPTTSDTLNPIDQHSVEDLPLSENATGGETARLIRGERTLTYDLHPLYAAILQDGAQIRQGEVLGLDGDLRRVLVAPFDGVIRLLVTGTGVERRVRVFLSEQKDRRESFAAGRR